LLYTFYLNKKTQYKDELSDKSTLIMFFLGPFSLLFINELKKYRKHLHYKKELAHFKMMRKFNWDYLISDGKAITEWDTKIQILERKIKLKKLKRKKWQIKK
jgi:uncharacterized protein YydD (DUF2326 family)